MVVPHMHQNHDRGEGNRNGTYKVIYDLTEGHGQLHFSPELSHAVCGFTIDDQDQRDQYLKNLERTRGCPNIVLLAGFDPTKNMILLEELSGTLLELVQNKQKEDFWEWVAVLNTWRMTPFLQNIIQGILCGIFDLHGEDIHIKIWAGNIVFTERDQHHKIPKIKDLINFDGKCNLLQMLIGLRGLIWNIAGKHQIHGSVAQDVKHFLDILANPPNAKTAEFLANHPALKRKGEKLKYIRDVRDDFRNKKLGGLTEAESKRNIVFRNWISTVKEYEHFAGMMRYEKQKFSKDYQNKLIDLVCFIRNVKEHLNQQVRRCQAEEVASPSTRNIRYSPLGKNKKEEYTDLEIELIFEKIFPMLVPHLYEYIHTITEEPQAHGNRGESHS